MATVIHERPRYDEPAANAGWIIAILVALLVLLAIFFLWRGGYFGTSTQIDIRQPAPTQQAPPRGQPGAPGAPGSGAATP
jgi:hypothetical protein